MYTIFVGKNSGFGEGSIEQHFSEFEIFQIGTINEEKEEKVINKVLYFNFP